MWVQCIFTGNMLSLKKAKLLTRDISATERDKSGGFNGLQYMTIAIPMVI